MSEILRINAVVATIGLILLSAGCSRKTPAPVVFGKSALSDKPQGLERGSEERPLRINPGFYKVKANETLYAISRKSAVSLRDLISINRLAPPYKLIKGQLIVIPEIRYYDVSSGDTLHAIARRQNVSIYALARHNRLGPPYKIRPGQRLRLPGGKSNNSLENGQRVAKTNGQSNLSKPETPRLTLRSTGLIKKPKIKIAPERAGSRFTWPVKGRVISRFGAKANGLHNDGINIAVKEGAVVRAADNGVVVYAGNELRGFGNLLLLRHRGGWITAYGHNQTLDVKVGEIVRQGQRIALAGRTGNTRRPQLHFEIRRGRRAVNPVKHLSAKQVLINPDTKTAG